MGFIRYRASLGRQSLTKRQRRRAVQNRLRRRSFVSDPAGLDGVRRDSRTTAAAEAIFLRICPTADLALRSGTSAAFLDCVEIILGGGIRGAT